MNTQHEFQTPGAVYSCNQADLEPFKALPIFQVVSE